ESQEVISASPHLEALQKRGYEVLYMTDPVDEWAAESLHEFDKKPLVSVMRADLKLNGNEEEKKAKEEQSTVMKPLLDRMQEVLKDHIREVRVSDRLTDSPCCLVISDGSSHAYMDRLLKNKGHKLPTPKRILEINSTHPLVNSVKSLHDRDPKAEQVTEWI